MNTEQQQTEIICPDCAVRYWVEDYVARIKAENHGPIWCPNGHRGIVYRNGEAPMTQERKMPYPSAFERIGNWWRNE